MTTTKSLEENRAISLLRVFCLDQDKLYCVPSVSGDGSAYQVQVSGESMLCSCPAGQHDGYCMHVAAVEMFRESQICVTTLGPWSWLPAWSGHRKTSWRICTNRHKKSTPSTA